MTETVRQTEIDAAKAYEGLMVPSLFGEWAPKVADAARIRAGERVLDVACGTGVLAREAAARVGAAGFVTGLDPGAGMLEVAMQIAPGVEWCHGTAESLPFPDESFDAVVSQFGLMFFADRREALRQALRVLKPGARMAVAVWDSLDGNPAYAEEVALPERLAGEPAADAVRTPFALGNRQALAALFADAGVAGPHGHRPDGGSERRDPRGRRAGPQPLCGCRWRRHLRDVRPPRHRKEALTSGRPYLYD